MGRVHHRPWPLPSGGEENAVKRHGLRRFYVVGEGVYGEAKSGSVDGKKLVPAKAADAAGGAPDATFRFSRMGPPGAAGAQLSQPPRHRARDLMRGYVDCAPCVQAIAEQIGGSGSSRASVHARYSEATHDWIGENVS